MVTHASLAGYLLRRGLVSARSVVGSDLRIYDASSRNRNYRVVSANGPRYLLKQGPGRDRRSTVANEARAYVRLADPSSAVARFVPRFCGYDADEDLLVVELVGGVTLRERHLRRGRFSKTVAAGIGTALATLHGETAVDTRESTASGWRPWILSIHRPGLDTIRDMSAANLELIKIVQRYPAFTDGLDELGRTWLPDSLLHNDVKFDNCIVRDGTRGAVVLVDWELAATGDSSWDVGSFLSEYLASWVRSIPVTGREPPERWPELARYPLSRMRPAIRSFWQAYRDARGLSAAESAERLDRSARYAAVRLLQTGIEASQYSLELESHAVCMLQLALNILQRPKEAAVALLGLPLETREVA